MPIDAKLVERLYRQAHGERWRVPIARFADALASSAERAPAPPGADPKRIERYLSTLHLEDLAIACACAAGDEAAWEHFIAEQRPMLYRAADALEPGGGARDLADSLYGDLFGLGGQSGERQSLFRYFHGRSTLSTWLRAVLAQRYVDRLRTRRRLEPLPDESAPTAIAAPGGSVEPDRDHYLELIQRTFARAVAKLDPRDRLRLACYYAQDLTLAEIGRLLKEHEATSSRQLARTRKAIREDVERQLRTDFGMNESAIAQCFASVSEDSGVLDVRHMLDGGSGRKESVLDRSR